MGRTPLTGLHHATMVSTNAQRTVDFYVGLLGIPLVKQTVNFDDPRAYHLYFGTDNGRPGTLLTFFEWKDMQPGNWGIGATHHLALVVDSDQAQLKWKRRLSDNGVKVTGPYDRTYFRSIYFTDPDGLILEIATRGPGWTIDEPEAKLGTSVIVPPESVRRGVRDEELIAQTTWPEAVPSITSEMQLEGFHHITAIASDIGQTTAFCTETLGLSLVKRTLNFDDLRAPHYYFAAGNRGPGTILTYFGYGNRDMRQGVIGPGMTHHIAFLVDSDDDQREWRDHLLKAGLAVTPVLDRKYFRSIYFHDPDGMIMEIATAGPGFLVDEPAWSIGTHLSLPAWLESQRHDIDSLLTPLRSR